MPRTQNHAAPTKSDVFANFPACVTVTTHNNRGGAVIEATAPQIVHLAIGGERASLKIVALEKCHLCKRLAGNGGCHHGQRRFQDWFHTSSYWFLKGLSEPEAKGRAASCPFDSEHTATAAGVCAPADSTQTASRLASPMCRPRRFDPRPATTETEIPMTPRLNNAHAHVRT